MERESLGEILLSNTMVVMTSISLVSHNKGNLKIHKLNRFMAILNLQDL